MNKTIYIAPEVEQIKVRFEENIMSNQAVINALSNSEIEETEEYSGSVIW